MRSLTITEFVRGLAWHDIAKPFAQRGWRHARLGYWLLWSAGYEEEALVALRHDKDVRNQYFAAKGSEASVPAVTMLANALDRLAASIYSFQSGPSRTDCHSLQNPFSRLPVRVELKTGVKRFLVKNRDLNAWEEEVWETKLPDPWADPLSFETKRRIENQDNPLPVDMDSLPDGETALKRMATALDIYPERTYPPVNDTSLRQHGRLTGILGFVVYRNLEKDKRIDVHERMTRDYQGHYQNHKQLVRTHLEASLVRITFTGVKSQVQKAARVDDLHGALTLAAYYRQALKETLAQQLQAPKLAAWLPISESQFELVYLLPGDLTKLRNNVRQAHTAATQQVSQRILDERLSRDFPEIGVQQDELVRQLSLLAYGAHIHPVKLPKEKGFDTFAAAYGRKLLEAYTQSQKDIPTEFPSGADGDRTELPASETCEVCGNHPVLTPPEDLDKEIQVEWLKKRDYAAHTFRGQQERLCLSCVARRTLAYGAIAKRMDDLTHEMYEPIQGKPGMWRRQPQDGLSLPPQMSTTVELHASDELQDIGAFYARFRRTADGVDRTQLDLFPTVTYAADKQSNVVLLALQPKPILYATYTYRQALKAWKDRPLNHGAAVRGWQESFVKFYQQQSQGKPELAKTIEEVEPHLARVMERIRWLKRFYLTLEDALIASQMRVLPLDTDFPTLRLLLPADRLDEVLQVLDRVVTEALFSATYFEDVEKRKEAHKLLRLIVPDLLHGAVVLFKQKFPLYLALEAERDIFHQLEVSDPTAPQDKRSRPGNADWYGFRLAFSDLRGSLSEVGPLHAEATYGNLGAVLDLVKHVDRRTIVQYAKTATYVTPELARAQALVRANQISRTSVKKVQQMNQDEDLFKAVYFITRAIRR